MTMVKNSGKTEMDAIWGELNKSYGSKGLFDADGNMLEETRVISTGSPLLDDILGVWGIPRGRLVQFAGRESSGKTFMSLMVIKSWQKENPKNWAMFFDAEHTFDKKWAKSLGVDLSRLKIYKENNGADIFERLCGIPHKEPGKPKVKPGILDIIKERGGSDKTGLGLIILDSIAAVAPPMELASVAGKNNMALMGRFLPPELRKTIPLLSESGVTLIAINQVRVTPGQMFGNPEKSTGGRAWKHSCSLMINFTRSEAAKNQIFDKNKRQIGHITLARVDKIKVAPPYRKCEFGIEYLKGIHNVAAEIGQLATMYGVVDRPNNKTYVYGDNKWVGKDNFYNALEDSKLADKIFEEVKIAKLNYTDDDPINTEDDWTKEE